MNGPIIPLVALAAAILLIAWGWRRVGIVSGTNQHSRTPLEPCWTEEIGNDGRYRYGRGRCVDDDLMEADARAARGEYQLPLND